MKISELARSLSAVVLWGENTDKKTMAVEKITVDSREAKADFIFAPVLGYHVNGGEFVEDAYGRGCRVFLSETNALPKSNCVIIKVENIRKSVAEIAKQLYKFENLTSKIIGITGTKGKTTIAFLIARLLDLSGVSSASIGTLGVALGDGRIIEKTQNTTPEPTALFKIISDLSKKGTEVIALEVSSQALKDFRVYGLEFEAVIFSSLGEDHIGKSEHESFTEYAIAKRSLFTDYKARLRIFNADDKYTPFMSVGTEKCIKCGFCESADYKITDFSSSDLGAHFHLNGTPVFSKAPARYDAVNFSIAITAASLISGISISVLAPLVSDITVPGRFERFALNGRTFIIDYAHNKISFLSVFSLTRRLYSGRIISVFGSVGGRSRKRRGELARISEKYADYSIITSDNPRYEPAEDICKEIFSHFNDKSRAEIVVDREKAIERAYSISRSGDVILLLGKGHEEKMEVSGKEIPFSDKKAVMKLKACEKRNYI